MGSYQMWEFPRLITLLLLCYIFGGHQSLGSWQGLKMHDGHLDISSDENKNINFQTSGRGYLHINSDNVLDVTKKVQRADLIVRMFKHKDLSDLESSINTLEEEIGLLGDRIKHFENVSGIMMPGSVPISPRLLFNRVRNIRIMMNALKAEVMKDNCVRNPCRNGGTCLPRLSSFHCLCPKNWEGSTCEEDVNECANFAGTDLGCQNKAICTNLMGSYKCECRDGWIGMHCRSRLRNCDESGSDELCGNGYCINQDGKVACLCHEGWTMDLSGQCTVDVDECAAKKPVCSHDPYVECYNTPGSFRCGPCPSGYTSIGHKCKDVNECEVDNGGCSKYPKVKCHNTKGSRICGECPVGYNGDGVTCVSAAGNVCNYNNGGCYPGAFCMPTSGFGGTTVECHCPLNYSGDGIGPQGCRYTPNKIQSVCTAQPCKNGGTCIPDTTFTYHCQCPPQFTGLDCGTDITGPCDSKPCQNGGICTVTNLYSIYGYKCSCQFGFIGETCALSTSVCVGSVTLDSGTLVYPNANTWVTGSRAELCHWQIQVNSKKLVQVKINSLKLSSELTCNSYVQIHDGNTYFSSSLGKFCSSIIPTHLIKSTTNIISIYAKLSNVEQESFSLTWSAIDASCVKYTTISNTSLIIESPGYPKNYTANLDCFWHLSVPEGKRMEFMFYTLSIEYSPHCHKDFLKVFNNDIASDHALLWQYCNISELAMSIKSTSHQALLYFHTDNEASAPGFRIGVHAVQGCGGVMVGDNGQISPPSVIGSSDQRHQNDLYCEWRIQLPLNSRIKIWFTNFNVEECSESCNCDYVEIYDGPSEGSPLIGKYCGDIIPPEKISSSNTITVVFKADILINKEGFTMEYETYCGGHFTASSGELLSPFYPSSYPSDRTCRYFIEQPMGKAIKLEVKDFDVEQIDLGDESESECFFDYLQIWDGHDESAKTIGTYCGGADKIPKEIISTYNYLYLKFQTDKSFNQRGFRFTYSTIDIACGGIIKDKAGIISSPLEDGAYPPNTRCNWLIVAPIGHVIHINWISFHIVYVPGCYLDYVEIYENSTSTGNGSLIKRLCGWISPIPISSVQNMMYIVFQTDKYMNRDGFKLNYTVVDAKHSCGGSFHSAVGSIKSPNFPEDYPPKKECVWTIQAPKGQQIRLNVVAFKLERASTVRGCRADVLEIRNGGYDTSPLIGQYCGVMIPSEILSFSNALYVKFTTDETVQFKGFHITWDSSATGCGGVLTAPSGSITTPNFPQRYESYHDCTWRISVAEGSKIQLNILELEIEEDPDCAVDYVEVYDGLNMRAKKLGRYCTGSFPPQILSSDNHLFIKFVSDFGVESKGFHMNYSAVCNTILKGHRGVIESFNFPDAYPPNTDCRWNITAPPGNNITIVFSHFDLENFIYTSCSSVDYLEISDKPNSQDASKFCGNVVPDNIISTTGSAYVHFYTDFATGGKGFRLEWSVKGCGEVFKDPDFGFFTSPGYPNSYPPGVVCEWYFQLPLEYSIQFSFHVEYIEESPDCKNDSLKIYGGPDDSAPLLKNICGRNSFATVPTSGSHAFIRFTSDSRRGGKGFSATYSTAGSRCGGYSSGASGQITSHNYPNNYGTNEDCEWGISVTNHRVINFTFVDFDVEPSEIDNTNTVLIYDGHYTTYPVIFNSTGKLQDLPSRSFLSTNNVLYVRHISDGSTTAKGFRATYHEACGARISDVSMGYITHTTTPLDIYCKYYITAPESEGVITLTISKLRLKPDMNVTVYDGETESDNRILKVMSGRKAPPSLMSTGPSMTITVFNPSRQSFDFDASFSIYDRTCGGDLLSEYGTITSPKYPDGYPANTECTWTITASSGNKAMVSFSEFSLEKSADGFCNEDYVEIRHKSYEGDLLGVYCGDTIPTNVTVSDAIWIKFKSDQSGTAKGFVADYTLMHGNELHGPSGAIASPLYPSIYHGQGQYDWWITVERGFVIKITFSDWFISNKNSERGCFNDLTIYDVEPGAFSILLEACGAENPGTITSTNNRVRIMLHNRLEDAEAMFYLTWEQMRLSRSEDWGYDGLEDNCTDMIWLDNMVGKQNYTISSRSVKTECSSTTYFNNEWTWLIETSQFFHLSLNILQLKFACHLGEVEIFTESDSSGWSLLSKQCGEPIGEPSPIVADRRIKIVYRFNNIQLNFKAVVQIACGGDVNLRNNATLNAYNLPSNKTGAIRQYCVWNVLARPGKTIKVVFKNFTLPTGSKRCYYNYIVLRNGAYEDSPYLGAGKYCGDQPPVMETSSNKLHIHFAYESISVNYGVLIDLVEVSKECGQDIRLNSHDHVSVSTPMYPNVPPSHITCLWRVIAPIGHRVYIEFNSNIIFSKSCVDEYLELRDGSTEMSNVMDVLCDNESPVASLATEGNVLYIKYFTNQVTPLAFTADVSVATCGGTQYLSYSTMTIRSPNYPDQYPLNSNCTWRLSSKWGHTMTFKFVELDVGIRTTNCTANTDFVEIIQLDFFTNKPTDTQLHRFCGQLDVKTVELLKVNTTSALLRFVSGTSRNLGSRRRFSIEVDLDGSECTHEYETPSGVITSPGFPSGQIAAFCFYKIRVAPGRSVKLTFSEFDIDSSTSLTVYQGDFNAWMYSGNESMQGMSIQLSSNEVTIYYGIHGHVVHRGFSLQYSSDQPMLCGGDLEASGFINFPGETNFTFLECLWQRISTQANTTFTVDIQGTVQPPVKRPSCTADDVTLCFTDDSCFYGMSNLCGQYDTPVTAVRSPYPLTKISLRNKKNNFNLMSVTNFTLNYKTCSCGGVIDSFTDVIITSPGYPADYPPDMDCAWKIQLMSANYVKIIFDFLDLDSSNDFISVYINGYSFSNSHLVGKYHGTLLPPPIVNSYGSIWLEFHSDSTNQGKGFKINVTAATHDCGGIEHSNFGFLSSPGYMMQGYQNNIECEWEIRVEPGYHIGLIFTGRFHLENSTNCTNDYVKVFDYKDDDWIPIGDKVCGRPNLPIVFNSTSSKMKLLFRSNEKSTGDGFGATWEVNCGTRIVIPNSGQGFITSPNYPGYYGDNLKCRYEISAPSKTIRGEFTHFALEKGESGSCQNDNLTVIQFKKRLPLSNLNYRRIRPSWGNFRNYYWNRMLDTNSQTFCGTHLPPPVQSRGNLVLNFQTDSYLTDTGFVFRYSIESCGSTNITAPMEIKLPREERHVDCTWIITAPKDKIVILRIEKPDAPFWTDCERNRIIVWTNSDNSTEVCDDSPSIKLYSTGNNMTIQFIAVRWTFRRTSLFVKFSHACGGTINLGPNSRQVLSSLDTDNDGHYEPDLDCKWLILAPMSYTVKLAFTRMDVDSCSVNSSDCSCDYIKVFDGDSATANEIGTYCGSAKYPSVMSFSNELLVVFVSDGTVNEKSGFSLTVEPVLSPCGITKRIVSSKETATLTSPGWGQVYPNNLNCVWILATNSSNTKLRIRFVSLDIEKSANCTKDRLEITDIQTNREKRRFYIRGPATGINKMTVCGQSFADYHSSTNTVRVKFITDSETTGKGFKLEYSFEDCNLNLTDTFGRINVVRSFSACRIRIKAPYQNNTISLYFTNFNILGSRSCVYSSLKIYDGTNSQNENIATLCGFRRMLSVVSTGPNMFIEYNPSSLIPGTFEILYTTTDQGRGCGGRLFGSEGILTSPLYPLSYGNASVCRWDIAVPHGYSLHFSFNDFNIGSLDTCVTDYLQIGETENDFSLLRWQFCGQTKPSDVEIGSGEAYIRYVTSNHNNGTGWQLRFFSTSV